MPDNLGDLALSVGADPNVMNPLNILAQSLERAEAIGQGNLKSMITADEVQAWTEQIKQAEGLSEEAGWEAVLGIREEIIGQRIGKESIMSKWGLSDEEAQAAMGTETGGISGAVIAQGVDFFADQVFTGSPASPVVDEEDDAVSKLQIINNMKDAFQLAMRNMGFSPNMINDLFEWANAKFQSDPSFTAERALMEMYEHPVFVARFPAIDKMRKSGMKNIPTPGQYIGFEKFLGQEFQRFSYNISGEAFDGLVERLILNQVGEIEVTERLTEAERVMYNVPQEVRDTFNDWWGSDGARNITMGLLLDPSENWSNLKDQIETAEVGGWGKMVAGLDAGWDRTMANAVADLGLSQAQTWNSFASLKDKELLFAENLTEDRNLDYATEGVSAEFGIDITNPITGELTGDDALTLQDLIERRKQRRISRFAGGGTGQAGAILTGSTTGIGSANA